MSLSTQQYINTTHITVDCSAVLSEHFYHLIIPHCTPFNF